MAHPPVDIVDENDQVIGSAMLRNVWEHGDRHRITRVIVEDKSGRILLQKRALGMVLYPGCWDASAAGHVDTGMTYEEAARQELIEELGLAAGELEEIGYYQSNEVYGGRILNRFNKLYRLRWNHTPELLALDEVSEVRWFTPQEVSDMVAGHPEGVSDGLRQAVEHRLMCADTVRLGATPVAIA